MTIKELKKGDWFTRKDIAEPNENQVFIRGAYDSETKKYECSRFSDVNDTIWLKGSALAFTGFTF